MQGSGKVHLYIVFVYNHGFIVQVYNHGFIGRCVSPRRGSVMLMMIVEMGAMRRQNSVQRSSVMLCTGEIPACDINFC